MDRIDALRLLLDVSEAGSFSSVARQRTVSISTVALAVSQLEQEFGARLLTRTTRRLVFTHEGEALLADARHIVSEWDLAISGSRKDGPLAGPIRVTTTSDFGRTQLRALLDAFQVAHPGITITLLLSDNAIDLIQNQVDLALRIGPLPDSSLRARLLLRGDRLVCATPAYWLRAGKPLHPRDLATHNCIIVARPGAPQSIWPFRDGGRPLSVRVSGDRQASDGHVVREWGVLGLGVIWKNHWDIRRDLEAGRLETALDDYVAGQIDLYAVQPDGPPTRRVTALVDYLAAALAGPPLGPP
ncbi:MAG: LysR family transcriptional regulator [Gemmatimonadaceae bacterium]|nr:LysR family transcriptional regulator [Acetobacteraceae bacterium]